MPALFARLLPLMPGWRHIASLAPTLRYDLALTAVPPPLDVAAEIRVPVHVMVGERSPESLHLVARALSEAIPGATHDVLAGQDHLVSERRLLPSLTRHLGQARQAEPNAAGTPPSPTQRARLATSRGTRQAG